MRAPFRLSDRIDCQISDDLVIRVIREMRIRQYLGGAEALSEAVVQFSRDAAALFVLCLQKLDAEPARFLLLVGALLKLLLQPSIVFPDQKDGEKERCDQQDYREAEESCSQGSPLVKENLLGIIDLIGDCCASDGRTDDIRRQFGLPDVILDPGLGNLDAFFAVGESFARDRFQALATLQLFLVITQQGLDARQV